MAALVNPQILAGGRGFRHRLLGQTYEIVFTKTHYARYKMLLAIRSEALRNAKTSAMM